MMYNRSFQFRTLGPSPSVIPAQAGTQTTLSELVDRHLGPGLRRDDECGWIDRSICSQLDKTQGTSP